jgi:light-regulated signal transduction histidine kinase (bacteriophytochrome)
LAAAALRMRELITDLLGYSQLQHNASPFESVNLNELFRDIFQEFEISVKEKDASFTIGILPTVHGSRAKLRQLFQNIISNSLKYSKDGRSLQIEISSTTFDNETTIVIKDNGIGFDNQQREKIFGLFQRLHAKDKYPGTGIGLSVCKKIAELHGGKVTAYSLPDEWATFEVTLPSNKVSI